MTSTDPQFCDHPNIEPRPQGALEMNYCPDCKYVGGLNKLPELCKKKEELKKVN